MIVLLNKKKWLSMVKQYQVRGGTNIFKGLITEVCRLPVSRESRLRFKINHLITNDRLK